MWHLQVPWKDPEAGLGGDRGTQGNAGRRSSVLGDTQSLVLGRHDQQRFTRTETQAEGSRTAWGTAQGRGGLGVGGAVMGGWVGKRSLLWGSSPGGEGACGRAMWGPGFRPSSSADSAGVTSDQRGVTPEEKGEAGAPWGRAAEAGAGWVGRAGGEGACVWSPRGPRARLGPPVGRQVRWKGGWRSSVSEGL